jgi:hypothetical protein
LSTEYKTIKAKDVLALYYPERETFVGIKAKTRESVPGLLIFEDMASLTLYQCATNEHTDATPKVLEIEQARDIVRICPAFNALILFKPPKKLVVEFL